MYLNYYPMPYVYPYVHPYQVPYTRNPYGDYYGVYDSTRQTVRGQATWTEGGPVTRCGIPWSANQYMTVAVGRDAPYACGQTLKIKNLNNQREVIVTVVDQVAGYPDNKVNLHRRAFEALGASVDAGIINIEITANPELETEKWGKYLLEIVQAAYSNYNVTDYSKVSQTQQGANQVRERYNFVLESPQETITVQATVLYNPNNDRVISTDFKEI